MASPIFVYKMVYWTAWVLVAVVSIQAQKLINPILSDRPFIEPCAIKVDGVYYLISLTEDMSKGLIPIHRSTDLVLWESAGFVFNNGVNTPMWADATTLRSPSIFKIGPNFVVYFSVQAPNMPKRCIGVAVAPHPLGPYTTLERPILWMENEDLWAPTLINDTENGMLFLAWSNGKNAINSRQLHHNGLIIDSKQTTHLLKPTMEWEKNVMYSPYHIKRAQYHYIFYDAGKHGIGYARGSSPLGPFDYLTTPFLLSQDGYTGLMEVSIVPDEENVHDIIFLQGEANGTFVILAASLSWRGNMPYVGPFKLKL